MAVPAANQAPLNGAITLATFREIAKAQTPTVVNIRTESRQRAQEMTEFFGGGDDLFRRFFGAPDEEAPRSQRRPRDQVVQAAGTGFIISKEGFIITNNHVVEGATKVLVSLYGEDEGQEYPARVVGRDPLTDSALLELTEKPNHTMPEVKFGDSSGIQQGDFVMAIGNPFGLAHTVSVGVVSALKRPFPVATGRSQDMIQTDAAINPGNSGGPLVNAPGEVVGINSSIFSSSGGSIGLGFAIPIERAVRVADEIVRSGAMRRAWTGLEVAGARGMAEWRSAGGVTVTSGAPGGPAARAGVGAGDVLTAANGRQLRNYLDWEAVKLDLHVGDAVTLSVRNAAGSSERRVVTGDLPSVAAEKVTVLRDLELVTVTPAIRSERDLRSSDGALIYRISAQVARATGLAAGDVVIDVNRTRIRDAEQLASVLRAMSAREPFRVTFERAGNYHFVDLSF
jgi:serine protease Do